MSAKRAMKGAKEAANLVSQGVDPRKAVAKAIKDQLPKPTRAPTSSPTFPKVPSEKGGRGRTTRTPTRKPRPTPKCRCSTPNAGTAGKNQYKCTDARGKFILTGYCAKNEVCFNLGWFPKGQWAKACKKPMPKTKAPTDVPSRAPTPNPTDRPTRKPTARPTLKPSAKPTSRPSTRKPTKSPTRRPTAVPTRKPTLLPSFFPTKTPSLSPSKKPTRVPTNKPTMKPSKAGTDRPSKKPTQTPTDRPSKRPSRSPTLKPTKKPTRAPTKKPKPMPKDLTPRRASFGTPGVNNQAGFTSIGGKDSNYKGKLQGVVGKYMVAVDGYAPHSQLLADHQD